MIVIQLQLMVILCTAVRRMYTCVTVAPKVQGPFGGLLRHSLAGVAAFGGFLTRVFCFHTRNPREAVEF